MKMIYMSQNPSNLFWLICRHKSVIQTHDDTNNMEIFNEVAIGPVTGSVSCGYRSGSLIYDTLRMSTRRFVDLEI